MANKAPADQFYFRDYLGDTRSLDLAARGAWMDFLSHAFFKIPQGRISQSFDEWARMWGCEIAIAKTVIEAIKKHDVGDVVTERNGDVTLINRRIYREWNERNLNNNRQKRRRDKMKEDSDEPVSRKRHGNVTAPSSSSSSSSTSSAKKNTHTREGPIDLSPDDFEYPIKELVEAFPNMRLTPAAIGYIESEVKPGDEIPWAKTVATYRMNHAPEHNRYLPEKTGTVLSVFRSEKDKYEKAREKNDGSNTKNSGYGSKRTDEDVIAESAEFYENYPS